MRKYVSRQESTLGRRRSNIPSLVCAFSASATTGGTIYCFGVLANDLKHDLGLSQLELGAISAAFFIAGLLSWAPGMVVDRQKMRFSMVLGGLTGALFTTLYWMACRHAHELPWFKAHAVAVLSVLAICICLSCGLIVGSVFKLTLLCGGPDGKGPSVGIAKGFVGLGSGVYATIFQAIRNDQESTLDFLLVIAFFFVLCAALPAYFLLPPKEESHPHLMKIESTPLHFQTMYAGISVLFLFIVASAISDILQNAQKANNNSHLEDPPPKERQYGKVVLILLLWLGPIVSLLFLPRKAYIHDEEEEEDLVNESTNLVAPNTASQPKILLDQSPGLLERGGGEGTKSPGSPAKSSSWRPSLDDGSNDQDEDELSLPPNKANIVVDFRADLSLPEMLQTASAWIMLWITLILVGSGTCKTNNMGQMVEALGFADSVTPATLAIFSVAQAAARITTGIVSESALNWNVNLPSSLVENQSIGGDRKSGIPRPFFLVLASAVALLAHGLLAVSTSLVAFVGGCTISAIAFGMAWPLMVLIVGDVFGIEHHGANYMFYDGGTKALGTMLLSEFLAGSVYEAHVQQDQPTSLHGHNNNSHTCSGPQCFRNTHLVIAGLAVTCIAASLLLCHQTRYAYSKGSH